MEDNTIIDYDRKNIEDYKKLAEQLFYYHHGSPMNNENIKIIAQATPKQRIQALNLSKMQSLGITSEDGVMDNSRSYKEKLGEALVFFYYTNIDLDAEDLLLIATATDEEKLEVLESYSKKYYAEPGSAIGSMDLSNEEIRISRRR